jgi:glycosyltransferase involved in cell wall biosynthesis
VKPTYELAFVGNMGYHPNVVAGRWLAERLLPILKSKHPGIRLLLAGARPARSIQALASPSVKVTGWVPDIRNAYQSGRLFVAPLFHGGGQQNKILEAMAMGLPCVTTSHVNEAIGGRHRKELLIADHEEAFSSQVTFLLDNPEVAASIGRRARSFVEERFSWEAANQQLSRVIDQAFSQVGVKAETTKK